MAEIYKEKIQERDELLKAWGSDLEDDDFYAALPDYEDGQFRPTEIDLIEGQRMIEMRKKIYSDMGYDIDEAMIEKQFDGSAYKETTIPVPVSPSVDAVPSRTSEPSELESAPTKEN